MKIVVGLTWLLVGCKALTHGSGPMESSLLLHRANDHLEAGEYFEARKWAKKALTQEPEDAEAQKLMAKILEQEISRHKSIFDGKALEEFSSEENQMEIRTWLERSESRLAVRQYDQALLAAEKVFLYDSDNLQASMLIDKIRAQAYRDGKREGLILDEMRRDEISERVARYRRQAREGIEKGQWGYASLAVNKIRILSPEDPVALALEKQIKAHESAP